MKIKQKLRNEWARLEDMSLQLTRILDDLEELEGDDVSPKTTIAYLIIQEKLKYIQSTQSFYERIGIFKEGE